MGSLGSALAGARRRARAAAVLVGGARALALALVALLAVLLASAQASDGTFDRTWGKDVGGPGTGLCTVAANCQAGRQGGLGGEFNAPSFVASDAAGNVYVTDTFNERVQKFDASGNFSRAWGGDVGGAGVDLCTVAANCQGATSGGQGGKFAVNGPNGLATDGAGDVYVTEFYGNRVQKFDSSGNFLLAWGKDVGGVGVHTCTVAASCQAGATGSAGGDLFAPEGIATDSTGNVYVADSANRRVQKFDSSGNFLRAWGKNVGGAGVAICTVAGSCRAGAFDVQGDALLNPTGVGTDTSGSVYITDSNLYRVEKFDSSGAFQRAWGKDVGGAGVDLCTVAADCQAGSQADDQGGHFAANGPSGIATDSAGDVYVANSAAGGRIQEFDSSGAFIRAWGKDVGGAGVPVCTVAANCQLGNAGGLGGEFASPAGVAIDSGGAVYVADSNNRRIQKFAGSATVVRTLTVSTSGGGAQTANGARAVVTGQGIDCSTGDQVQHNHCSTTVADGTQITLTATPAQGGGAFTGFTGGGCGATSPCTVTINADQSVDARFAGPPSAIVGTPPDGGTYPSGTVVNASYSCSAGADGGVLKSGAAGCSGPVPTGSPIDTATAGAHTFSVTATDTDGQTATTTSHYTVAAHGPPSAVITTPADGASYSFGANVNASYSCSAGANGGVLNSGAAGCSGPVPTGSPIDTATAGSHTFSVTATDTDGQTAATTSHYTVAAPGPPAGRPSAVITTPADGASYAFDANVNASYSCSAGANGGVLKPGAAGCSGPVPTGSPIDTLAFGTHTFTVTATDTDGQTTTSTVQYTLNYNTPSPPGPLLPPIRPQRPLHSVIVNPRVDIRVTGIEVTQGIQANTCSGIALGTRARACPGTLPARLLPLAMTPGQATYQGVTMAAGHFTVVRVFAHFTGIDVPGATSLRGATAVLTVLDASGHPIYQLSPASSPAALSSPSCVACVSESERANPNASFDFVVPWNVTYRRTLSFSATVNPPIGLGGAVQCPACKANTFVLKGVPFVSTATVRVFPIPLTVGGQTTKKTEYQVLGTTQAVLPVNTVISGYEAPLAVDGMTSFQAAIALAQRASDDHYDGTEYPVGVFDGTNPNLNGLTLIGRVLYGAAPPISIVNDDRPISAVMHEIGHGLGLVHADTGSGPQSTGPHPDGTPDCGGNSGGQVGEAWPPDNEGLIQDVGLDARSWNVARNGSQPRIVASGHPASGNLYYDFMSYCPGPETAAQSEADRWISVRNWTQLLAFHAPAQGLAPALDTSPATGTPTLRVIATVDPAGKSTISDIAPGQRALGRPTDGSPYRLELRDAAGATLASVIPATTTVHTDGHRPGLLLEATLPFAPSAGALVLSAGGVELARRSRSAHAPTAAIVSPRPRTRIGRGARTLVRWRAHDVDGDRLTTTVDYSADGGRHWKVVASSASANSVRVPNRLLSTSRNARFRVRVSDGFNLATVISGPLHAVGSRPFVHIVGGPSGGRIRADAILLLRGAAYDDADNPLTGRSLRWYAGRRLLGRGELLTVPRLPVGTTAVRLVATDRHGRSSQARLPIRVLAVPPTFLLARAPGQVSPGARRVRVVVASSVPATLRIGGKRYAINRKPRAITIPIRRGHSILRLAYVLSAGGGVTRGMYLAAR